MKILHCIHSLSGGGAERQLKLLVAEANNKGEDYAIYCVNSEGNNLPVGLVKIYHSSKKSKLSVFGEIEKAIKDFNPDIVHVWLPFSVTIPALIIAKLNRKIIVSSYRNAMMFNRLFKVVEYMLIWICSDGIISNNPISMSRIQYRILFKKKIGRVIPNAVKIDNKYKKSLDSKKNAKKTILFVGRLTKQKNWQCLINAMPAVIKHNNEIQLLVCGDGEDKDKFIRLVNSLGLENNVSLRGYEKNIYQVMKDADVLVSASWFEGMPNVLLEALEIGLPCIVSKINAHLNVLNDIDTFLLFDPSSSKDLSSKIISFLSEENHENMVIKGWEIASQYTLREMVSSYKAYYRLIINN